MHRLLASLVHHFMEKQNYEFPRSSPSGFICNKHTNTLTRLHTHTYLDKGCPLISMTIRATDLVARLAWYRFRESLVSINLAPTCTCFHLLLSLASHKCWRLELTLFQDVFTLVFEPFLSASWRTTAMMQLTMQNLLRKFIGCHLTTWPTHMRWRLANMA